MLSRETFDGHACAVFEFSGSGHGLGDPIKVWIWEDNGFPLKVELFETKNGKTTLSERIVNQNIKIGPIPDELFEIPKTKEVVQADGYGRSMDDQLVSNLWYAVEGQDVEADRQLLKRVKNVNVPYKRGETLLSHSMEKGHLPIVKALVEKGADVNIADQHGYTPLMDAAVMGW